MPLPLNAKRIASFWFPLLTAWLLMAVEGPLISAMIARMALPKLNLAAYGVAFVIALIVEAPIIMMMSASTALVRDRASYQQVLRFTTFLNAGATLLTGLVLVPPVFDRVTLGWMSLPPEIAHRVYLAVFLLLPWPAAIGFRRFYQGVMIVAGETRKVMGATVLRVIAMASACLLLSRYSSLDGAAIGGAALSSGVVTEALVVRVLASSAVRKVSQWNTSSATEHPPITLGYFTRFYYPLFLTAFLTLGVQPIVTFFVGRAAQPIESLAILPVLHSITFFFRCFSLSFQEVIVSLAGPRREQIRPLCRFASAIALVSSSILLVLAFSPLSRFWFESVAGLEPDLARLAETPLRLIALLPALSMLGSYWTALALHARQTAVITVASILEVAGIALTLVIGTQGSTASGALLASLGLVIGRSLGSLYLWAMGKHHGTGVALSGATPAATSA